MKYNLNFSIKMLLGVLVIIASIGMVALSHYYPVLVAKLASSQGIYVRTIPLDTQNTIKHGKGYSVDISDYGLVTLADTDREPARSPLLLLEKGKALLPHASEQDIAQGKPGILRHARPSVKTMAEAYDYERNRKDRVVFIPYADSTELNSFSLTVPATKADAWSITAKSQAFKKLLKNTVIVSFILMLLGCALIIHSRGTTPHYYYQVPILLALACAYYFMTANTVIRTQLTGPPGAYTYLNSFGISPDTSSYYPTWDIDSSRTPGYPWFIRLVAKKYSVEQIRETTPVGVSIDYPHPFKRVNTVQILLLLLAGLILMQTIMHYFKSPLPVIPFLFIYVTHYYVWYEFNFILTETLMQAALLVGTALCLAFFFEKKPWLLAAAALFLGYAYLVRPAGIFGSIILGAAMLYALWCSWRGFWRPVVLSFLVYMLLFFTPNLHGLMLKGKFFSGADSYQYKICYALRLAQPEDVNLLPTKDLRNWFVDAMAHRATSDAKYDKMTGDNVYNRLVYRIQSVYEAAITDNPNKLSVADYNRISGVILKHRRADYLKFSFDFWKVTIFGSQVDRIGLFKLPSWVVYGLMLLLGVALRGKIAYFSGVLVMSHWLHVFICCLFSAPIARMVWSSDILVIIALTLLLVEAVQRILDGLERRKSRTPELVEAV